MRGSGEAQSIIVSVGPGYAHFNTRGPEPWLGYLPLDCWRTRGGAPVTEPVVGKWRARGRPRFSAGEIVRVTGKFETRRDEQGRRVFSIIDRPRKTNDAELQRHAQYLARSIRVAVPGIGTLRYRHKYAIFEGKMHWGRTPITLEVPTPSRDVPQRLIELVKALRKRRPSIIPRLKQAATKRLLRLANGDWLLPGQPKYTTAQFEHNLRPTLLVVHSARSFRFYFDSSDMFDEHEVYVQFNPRTDRITDCSFE